MCEPLADRKLTGKGWRRSLALVGVLLTCWLFARTSDATSYTWIGTTSSDWTTTGNWSSLGFPNAYTDTATIGATGLNKPVILSISSTVLLGGGGTVLTTSGTSALSPLTINGTLGLQGNIVNTRSSGTGTEKITINGTLRNDAASSATTYSIGGSNGSISLGGGTISSLNGGIWAFQQLTSGYGTISAPFTNTSTISANSASGALHITGSSTAAGILTSSGSGILSIESAITGGTVGSGAVGEIDLNGATLNNLSYNASSGTVKLTGDSTIMGTFARNNVATINLNGHTLNLSGATISGVTGGNLFTIGSATLNNSSASTTSTGNDGTIALAGGTITSTGGGSFNIGTVISGYGTITAPLIVSGSGAVTASGGTLTVSGNVDATGHTMNTGTAATDILDLQGTITGGFLFPSFSAGSQGKVYIDGATLVNTTWIGHTSFPGGTVTVTDNSILNLTSFATEMAANFTINNGKQLTISGTGGTLRLDTGSSFTNNGTLAIGSNTLSGMTGATVYTLGGTGTDTLAGGSITSNGTGGFTSVNTLRGYGNVTAPYTNQQKVIADGNGTSQTLTFTATANGSLNTGGLGWFAQNTGKLILPATAISADGAKNWGGDPATLGMVNSVGLNFHGVTAPGNLSIAVLSLDRPEIPTGLTNAIGVWQFTASGGLTVTSMDATFRYDDAVATALGADESLLTLYHYNGTAWDLVSGTTVDTTNNILAAFGLTSFSYYAIEEASVAVPEPGAWLGASLSAAALLVIRLWRVRRRRAKIPICYSMLGEGSKRDGAIAAALLTSKRLADM
jgi:hypothetical protein